LPGSLSFRPVRAQLYITVHYERDEPLRGRVAPFIARTIMASHKFLEERKRSVGAGSDRDRGIERRGPARLGCERGKSDRKARQLCSQVAETLSYVFAEQHGDDVLQSLSVLDVEPAPDASRLLVTVWAQLPSEDVSPERVMESLTRASGRLRTEVASAITRRRAPTLVYRVLDSPEGVENPLP
jgi:ribosome-binding factor A